MLIKLFSGNDFLKFENIELLLFYSDVMVLYYYVKLGSLFCGIY